MSAATNPIKDLIYCPITRRIMSDPVVTALGDTFEREAIEEWLRNRDTNPTTGEPLPNKQLSFNKTVKQMIDVFLENHPEYQLNLEERYVSHGMTEKLRDAFDANDVSALNYILSSHPYLQLYEEFQCCPIMVKGMASYLDDGNICHVLCECPNTELKTFKTLMESLQRLEDKHVKERPSLVSNLVSKTIFGKNSRGLQPIHTACYFNECEQLFKELIQMKDQYSTLFSKCGVSLQHEDLDPRCRKNVYLLMFKLIITSTPAHKNVPEKEIELNEKCLDFIFDNLGLSGEQLLRITHQGVSLINYACKYNRLHILKKMVEKTNVNLNQHVDTFYHTPLTSAVLGGALEVVKYLIEEAKVDVEVGDVPSYRRDFPTALHLAVLRGHFDIAMFLISHGANVNATCKMSTVNGSISSSCLEPSDICVNKALFGSSKFMGLDVSSPSLGGSSSSNTNKEEEVHNIMTLCLLLCSDRQETSKRALEFISQLVSKYGYIPTFPQASSTTISPAVFSTSTAQFSFSPSSMLNEPLWFCIRTVSSKTECEHMFEWVLNQFYSDKQKLFMLRDRQKNNALHWLAAYARVENLEMTILHLTQDVDVHLMINQKNQQGDTPLHVASALGRKDICKLLIDLGADVRIRNAKLQDALSAGFVCNAVPTLTAQYRMNFLKDLRKCLENRDNGRTILTLQAKIRMLEKKLQENMPSSLMIDP
ncbi:hypothetical protein FDP41_007550 [Naegleria fowleri]|uniref:U-box domain-containing protein n=1 Tax=Naegleria fowleri TaxID=5763 RepID=A0A6A5C1S5_NAEFO|nr:uncharacterized protein FDP41_007550 [Naegleria fowleri]KAF0984373.1 hypothetical protein FDP41_007550 [Naegleria fowleri]CAG4717602.1 unnamed protein product [Naegleria fowleri]